MNIFTLSSFIAFSICEYLAVFVYLKNPRSRVNKSFAVETFFIGVWTLFPFATGLSHVIGTPVFIARVVYIAAILVPPTFLFFALNLIDLHDAAKERNRLRTCYLISAGFLLSSFSPYFIRSVNPSGMTFAIVPGALYHLFFAFFAMTIIYGYYKIFMRYREVKGFKRNQLLYVLIAFVIAGTAGFIHFLSAYGVREVYPHDFLVILFTAIVAYSIIRYRTMEVNIVFKKTAAYSLAAGLLTGLFVALVLSITNLFSTFANAGSFKVSIFAALLIALLFNPLRHRIQSFIDSTFYKKTYDYYATVRQVSSKLASMFDHDGILKFIGDTLYDLLGLKSVYLLTASSGRYETAYYLDKKHKHRAAGDKDAAGAERLFLNKRSGIAGFYRRSDDIIVRDELDGMGREADREAEHIINDLEPFHGEVAVPVFVDRKLALLIVLGGKVSGDMFSKEDVDLLKTISNQTSAALKNARLYREKINSERLASIGMMSATFAHEIRNPLTSLKTFAQLMPEKYNDVEFRETFSRIVVGEIEKIDGLISDLLDFSSRKKTSRMNNYDLTELLDIIIEDVRGKLEFEKTNIAIEKNYNGRKIQMSGDARKLKQAFGNIILNGCQAMNGEGVLRVDIKERGKYTDVEIRDTGEGIQQEDLPKIFDPFVTTKEVGVGLGLAISKRVIEDHNGKIHVVSQPAKGTAFTISLPVQNE
ncbi:MAG: hypothetical protein HZA16_06150 [Nitrospirae bacterium]|nr:hypothetical protein [Nitrospirota bacterium]